MIQPINPRCQNSSNSIMFINSKNTILLLVKRKKEVVCVYPEDEDIGVKEQVGHINLEKAGRPKKKKEPLTTDKGRELKKNVPFICKCNLGDVAHSCEGKSKKHYCDHCIKRDGEEYKDQTCSYRTPATANKSQYYRNHVAMNECPNCHNDLGIEYFDWETLPKEEKK